METISKNQKGGRLNNYMEELASDILHDLLAKHRAQFSAAAIQDIKALALNRLWPMYTTTSTGKNFLKKIVVEDRVTKDVIRELRVAMDIVKANPRK